MLAALARLVLRLVALLLSLSFPAIAAAEPRADSTPVPAGSSPLWRTYPTFSWTEGAATVAAGAMTLGLALRAPAEEPRWRGGILFDDAVRDRVRLSAPKARQRARFIGDLPYYAAPALPLVVDPLVALLVHDDARAAWNLEWIGLEAFSYAGLLSFVSTSISRRERPDATECLRQHPDGAGCKRDTEAFWSGHTSIAAASAGLVCANHRYLALWRSPLADAGACGLALTGALTTSLSRLLADRHYASDVLVGMGVGFAFGYAVPVLLHYGRGPRPLRVSIVPEPSGGGASLSVAGSL